MMIKACNLLEFWASDPCDFHKHNSLLLKLQLYSKYARAYFFFLGPAALDWEQCMQFATKIIIAVRDDLQPWQELNITAFLMSGIVAETPNIIGKASSFVCKI